MSKINSRAKGASAERELIKELRDRLGDDMCGLMKRNLEQSRKGGHDIDGLDGWAIEVKRYKSFSETEITKIWEGQAVSQARKAGARPVLAYRADFRPWRFRLPMTLLMDPASDWSEGHRWRHAWTADLGIEAFSLVVREVHSACVLRSAQAPITMQV